MDDYITDCEPKMDRDFERELEKADEGIIEKEDDEVMREIEFRGQRTDNKEWVWVSLCIP